MTRKKYNSRNKGEVKIEKFNNEDLSEQLENIEEVPVEIKPYNKDSLENIEEQTEIEYTPDEEKSTEKIPVEVPVENEVQFQWDGVLREGLFGELMDANLSAEEEDKWAREFAGKGLAYRTILKPKKSYTEVIKLKEEIINVDWTMKTFYEAKKFKKEGI